MSRTSGRRVANAMAVSIAVAACAAMKAAGAEGGGNPVSFSDFDRRAQQGERLTASDPAAPDRLWALDGAHPVDEGYALFAQAACLALEGAVQGQRTCRVPETMLHADSYMTWSRNRLSQLESLPSGWTPGLASRTSAWLVYG